MVHHANGWRISLGVELCQQFCYVYDLCVVKTPNSLIERGKYDKTKKML